MNMQDVINTKIANCIDYKQLLSNCKILSCRNNSDPYINVIIPNRNRCKQLEIVIKSLLKAKKCFDNINIIVAEEVDDITTFCTNINKEYSVAYFNKTGPFNLALLFNLGFLVCPRTEWTIFHNNDIIVPEHFFSSIIRKINSCDESWIQPYKNKRLLKLSKNHTDKLLENEIDLSYNEMIIEAKPEKMGNMGGSIVVRSDIIESIGGYDPELFHEYAPEDCFFWNKLSANIGVKGSLSGHSCGASYLDDVELLHFNHQINKTKFHKSWDYLKCFQIANETDRRDYIEISKALFTV